jgi:Endomembrane protein 70
VLLWSCISVPLCLLGTVVGRNWAGHPDNPCRVKRIPSPIPQKQVLPARLCGFSLCIACICNAGCSSRHIARASPLKCALHVHEHGQNNACSCLPAAVVPAAVRDCADGRAAALRQHLHRSVLHSDRCPLSPLPPLLPTCLATSLCCHEAALMRVKILHVSSQGLISVLLQMQRTGRSR